MSTPEPLLGQAIPRSVHGNRKVWPFALLSLGLIGFGCTLILGNASNTDSMINMAAMSMQPTRVGQAMRPMQAWQPGAVKTWQPMQPERQLSPLTLSQPGFARAAAPSQRTGVMAAATQTYEITQPKPTGVQFKDTKDGIVVSKVDRNADPKIRVGDKLLAVSASFGGEVWPAKSYQQSMFALSTRVGQVYMKLESTGGRSFGKVPNQPVAQHVCLDCGWIYNQMPDSQTFQQLPSNFVCPQCQSSKNRFAKVNMATGKAETGLDVQSIGIAATVIGGLVGVGLIAYIGFTLS